MAKVNLPPIGFLPSAGANIDSNFQKVAEALEKTLSRDGTPPNSMGDVLDMNNNRIINLPPPLTDTEPMRRGDIVTLPAIEEYYEEIVNLSEQAVDAAERAEDAAEGLENIVDLLDGKFDKVGGTITGRTVIQRTVGTGGTFSPDFEININENYTAGGGFYIPVAILSTKGASGTGNREAVHIEQKSSSSTVSEFVVGLNAIGRITAGSGNAFGVNGYAWVDAAASATASCIGGELNVDARRSVVTKSGLQIVDVATSTGQGTTYDAGLIIGTQAGGAMFQAGILFGYGASNTHAVRAGGTLISGGTTTNSLDSCINLAGIASVDKAAIILRPQQQGVWFGTAGEGGRISGEAAASGGRLAFIPNGVLFRDGSGNEIGRFDPTHTYLMLYDGTNSILRRVLVDAADSGGTGYRSLKVEN